MKVLESGLKVPDYFFSAIECGIKYKGRLDYSLIYSKKPCNAAGVFTKNKIFAAPVRLCRERINNRVQAILINATNANACTGQTGYNNALSLTGRTAEVLGLDAGSVLMASTGVIGVQLPEEKMRNAVPQLADGLSEDKGPLVTEAIMTTDTFPKSIAVSFSAAGAEYVIAGTIKGAGMIAPDMATLLCFVLTDCPVDRKKLDIIFRRAVDKTLNSITIDGDMSTNDTAIILSPVSDNYVTGGGLKDFEDALEHVLARLGEMIIMDAEGATKKVNVRVIGAETQNDAKKAAKSVSESLLVKTAFFGKDPNWGRIAAAAGYSGANLTEEKLSIYFEDIPLLVNGTPAGFDKSSINDILSRREFSITVDLGMGKHEAIYVTSDISYDYVKINAEYTT